MTKHNTPIICLMGPTASGKTALAIELVKQLPLEIISVDSAMVYRGMDIGTAKPSANELKQAPHRLIDICEPSEAYSAGQFCQDALTAIHEIREQGKIPLLVGGTMLYFHLLQRGFSQFPVSNLEARQKIDQEASEIGWPALHNRLQSIDPMTAKRLHPNDSQRIQRALELYYSTGQTLSEWHQQQRWSPLASSCINLVIAPKERVILHERIEKRLNQMFKAGFREEVLALYQHKDLSFDLPAIRAVGYRQMWQHFAGQFDYEEAQYRVLTATRQFAKRQLTWLRRWQPVKWLESSDDALVNRTLDFLDGSISW